ncbi:MAG: hypothetical protein ACJ789_03655 [Thermomicrobiales bacterium]
MVDEDDHTDREEGHSPGEVEAADRGYEAAEAGDHGFGEGGLQLLGLATLEGIQPRKDAADHDRDAAQTKH